MSKFPEIECAQQKVKWERQRGRERHIATNLCTVSVLYPRHYPLCSVNHRSCGLSGRRLMTDEREESNANGFRARAHYRSKNQTHFALTPSRGNETGTRREERRGKEKETRRRRRAEGIARGLTWPAHANFAASPATSTSPSETRVGIDNCALSAVRVSVASGAGRRDCRGEEPSRH